MRRYEMDHEKHVREQELKHHNMITMMRQRFDTKAKELHKKYQDKMRIMRGEWTRCAS